MRDILCLVGLNLGFALLLTVHAAIALGLAFRSPTWRAPVALIVPPLALYWAFSTGMRVRAIVWIFGLLLYVVAYAAALL